MRIVHTLEAAAIDCMGDSHIPVVIVEVVGMQPVERCSPATGPMRFQQPRPQQPGLRRLAIRRDRPPLA
jgi:hypothetical protein